MSLEILMVENLVVLLDMKMVVWMDDWMVE